MFCTGYPSDHFFYRSDHENPWILKICLRTGHFGILEHAAGCERRTGRFTLRPREEILSSLSEAEIEAKKEAERLKV